MAENSEPSQDNPTAPPGWYTHPTMADTRRYWDGARWTDSIAPADTSEQQPSGGIPHWLWWFITPIIGLAVYFALFELAPNLLSSNSVDDVVEGQADPTDINCDDLADDAVRISAEQGGGIQLIKVRDPSIIEDSRSSYQEPSGTSEVVVLGCEGLGVYDSGDEATTRIELTVDSDGEFFVSYEAVGR